MTENQTTFKPVKVQPMHGGEQRQYRFDNGYGASVINHMWSYGTELAVIKWTDHDFEICYDTPITDDVIGHLSESEIAELLERISKLSVDGTEDAAAGDS